MEKKNRRQQIIIDRERQLKLFIIMVIYILITVFLVSTAMFFPSMMDLSSNKPPRTSYELDAQVSAGQEFTILHHRFWPAVLLLVVLLGLHSVVILHRIFGPLYRLRNFLEQVSKGDFSQTLHFRKHDYLEKEQVSVNQMIQSVGTLIDDIKSSHEFLENDLKAAIDESSKEEADLKKVKNKLKEIGEKQALLSEAIAKIKTA